MCLWGNCPASPALVTPLRCNVIIIIITIQRLGLLTHSETADQVNLSC
jgi:hypothetical protein